MDPMPAASNRSFFLADLLVDAREVFDAQHHKLLVAFVEAFELVVDKCGAVSGWLRAIRNFRLPLLLGERLVAKAALQRRW